MISTIRQHVDVIEVQKPQYFATAEQDFFPLEKDASEDAYFISTQPTPQLMDEEDAVDHQNEFLCPATLHEMLQIVRELQRQK